MLQQVLKEDNFNTAAFTGGGYVSKAQGFNRGFETWSEGKYLASHMPHVIDWLENNRSENFFLFFHFYDVHDPYILRDEYENMYHDFSHFKKEIELWKSVLDEEEVTIKKLLQLSNSELLSLMISTWIDQSMSKLKNRGKRAVERSFKKKWNSLIRKWNKQPDYLKQLQFLIDSYDAGIRYSDNILSELFSFLRSNEMWDNTIIIITSDHGEEFMEHDMLGHGRRLYDTLLHVPLIIKMPTSFNTVPKRISGLREIIDIMPTLLDACDIKFKKQMQGKSLLSLMINQAEEKEEMVFASFKNIKMIRSPQWKYVFNDNSSRVDEFFNLRKDKFEQFNLIEENNSHFNHMQLLLKAHIKNCISLYNDKYSKNRKSRKSIPQEDLKKQIEVLKALGYVN
jgi:arylsulfatase A-like enzyme